MRDKAVRPAHTSRTAQLSSLFFLLSCQIKHSCSSPLAACEVDEADLAACDCLALQVDALNEAADDEVAAAALVVHVGAAYVALGQALRGADRQRRCRVSTKYAGWPTAQASPRDAVKESSQPPVSQRGLTLATQSLHTPARWLPAAAVLMLLAAWLRPAR